MAEGMLTRTVGPKAAKRALKKAFSIKRPIFMWGPAGVGKSDLIKDLGAELNAHVIDVRLSLWEPTDIKGIPYFDSNANTMVWAPPSELPNQEFADQHELIILFLDEMNSAAPSVQAAAYQLILNRRVGQYKLPDNVVMVAAGNRDGDKGVTYRMPAPLANRFVHLEVSVDWDDWFEWATVHKIHNDVVGYLNANKQELHNFNPKTNERAFATPRSWSFVSELLQDDDTEESTIQDLISGAIGDGLSVKFMAYKRMTHKLPDPRDILAGRVTKLETKEISAMYSLAISLCYELKDAYDKQADDLDAKFNHFFKFISNNFETELVIMVVKIALSTYALPIDPYSDYYDEFTKNYGKYISAAL